MGVTRSYILYYSRGGQQRSLKVSREPPRSTFVLPRTAEVLARQAKYVFSIRSKLYTVLDIQIAFILPFSFYSKIMVIAKKKVFSSVSSLTSLFFSQNRGVLLKKKIKKGVHFDSIPSFPILFPKSRCSLKKEKEVFTSKIARNLEKSGQKLGNREIDSR